MLLIVAIARTPNLSDVYTRSASLDFAQWQQWLETSRSGHVEGVLGAWGRPKQALASTKANAVV